VTPFPVIYATAPSSQQKAQDTLFVTVTTFLETPVVFQWCDREKYRKTFKLDANESLDVLGSCCRYTCDDSLVYSVWVNAEFGQNDITLIHEVSHLTTRVMDELKIKDDEFRAYHMDMMIDRCWYVQEHRCKPNYPLSDTAIRQLIRRAR
jgi:hypothetical protein